MEDRAIFIGFLLLLTFPIHGYLFILAHELGHALAGMLVGVEIHEIELGVGRELFTFNLGSIRFVIRRVAVMGVTRGNVRDLRHGRIKRLIYIAGGPAADAAVLMIALMLVDGDPTPATPWLGSIIFIEAMFLLSDLTPRYVSLGDTRIGTDSQQIIELIRGDSWRSWTTAMYAIGEILIRYGARPEDRPYNFLRNRVPGLRLYDNAHKAFIGDRYSDFIEAVETILRDHDPTVAERGMLLDWLCNLVVINGLREYLPQADAWSLTALTLRPAMPTLTSTRGAILIEMGELDAGIAILLPIAMEPGADATDRLVSACYLAKAYHHLDDAALSRQWLDAAVGMHAPSYILERIRREIIPSTEASEWDMAMREALIRYGANAGDGPVNFLKNAPGALTLFRRGTDALEKGEMEICIEAYEELLTAYELTSPEGGLLLDSLCTLVLENGLEEYHDHAIEWSRVAHELLPDIPTIRGTRGAILIEMGELDVGIAMLLPLIAGEHEEIDRTMSIAYLAKAHHRNGEHERALDYLDLATSLAPDNPVVMRIGREIAPERFG